MYYSILDVPYLSVFLKLYFKFRRDRVYPSDSMDIEFIAC